LSSIWHCFTTFLYCLQTLQVWEDAIRAIQKKEEDPAAVMAATADAAQNVDADSKSAGATSGNSSGNDNTSSGVESGGTGDTAHVIS
jgi:hypothetical protein